MFPDTASPKSVQPWHRRRTFGFQYFAILSRAVMNTRVPFFFFFLLRTNICFRGSGTAARDCAAGWRGGSTSAVPRSRATLPLLTPARRVRAVRCSHVLAAAAAVTVFRFSCPDGRGAGARRDLVRLPLMANDTEYPVACLCGVRLFSLKAAPGACVSRVSLNEFSRVHRTV